MTITIILPISLLSLAKQNHKGKGIRFIKSNLINLPKKLNNKQCDLVVMVRVLHHIEDLEGEFKTINKLTKKNGYLILEFANKKHFKSMLLEYIKANFMFAFEILPKDLRNIEKTNNSNLPFKNYHPDQIKNILTNNSFEIIEGRSVSNIRSRKIKKFLPLSLLLYLENFTQNILYKVCFGPSLFLLAKKI